MKVPEPKLLTLMGFNATGDFGALTAYTSQRGQAVWFPRMPPLNPPSPMQRRIRNLFRLYATQWRALSPNQRHAWLEASRKAGLRITGYNLYVYYQRTKDEGAIRTIERLTGESLI